MQAGAGETLVANEARRRKARLAAGAGARKAAHGPAEGVGRPWADEGRGLGGAAQQQYSSKRRRRQQPHTQEECAPPGSSWLLQQLRTADSNQAAAANKK